MSTLLRQVVSIIITNTVVFLQEATITNTVRDFHEGPANRIAMYKKTLCRSPTTSITL